MYNGVNFYAGKPISFYSISPYARFTTFALHYLFVNRKQTTILSNPLMKSVSFPRIKIMPLLVQDQKGIITAFRRQRYYGRSERRRFKRSAEDMLAEERARSRSPVFSRATRVPLNSSSCRDWARRRFLKFVSLSSQSSCRLRFEA